MKNLVKKVALFLAFALTITLVDANIVGAASKITLKSGAAAPASIYTGHSYTLKVAGTSVYFYSNNKSIATIGKTTGKMKVVAPGTVKITAKNRKTGKAVATKSFTVLQRATAITPNQTDLYLSSIGETAILKASLTPATSTDAIKFYSANKSIATVGMTSGKVTAKGEGATTISVYALATKSTAKSSKYNKVAAVNVFVGTFMESAVQKTTTDIALTFNSSITDVKASDFTITNNLTNEMITIKSAEINETNKNMVTLVTYNDIKDGAAYTVTYGNTSAQFTATDGIIANIQIDPTVVTAGKETKIYVVATDINGVQVGKYENGYENLEFTIDVSDGYVTSDNALYLNSTTSTAKAKATLHTWKYETVNGSQVEVGAVSTGEVTITATAAEMVSNFNYTVAKSTPAWTSTSFKQNTTICAGDNDYNMYFNFSDASKNVVTDYSCYSFSSSNEDVLLVTSALNTTDNSISLVPIKAGTAYIIVKNASTNVVVTTLAVTVKEAAKPVSFVLDKTAVTVSNAAEAADTVEVGYSVLDQYNNKLTATSVPVPTRKTAPSGAAGDIISIADGKIKVNAAGMTAGTYVYELKYDTLTAKILTISVKQPAENGVIGFSLGLSTTSIDAVVTDAASMNKTITINPLMTKGGVAYKALSYGANAGDGTTYNNVAVSFTVKNSKSEVQQLNGNEFAVVTNGKAVAAGTYTVTATFTATKVSDGNNVTLTKTTSFTVTNSQLPVTFERVSKEYNGSGSVESLINECYSFYYDGVRYGKNGTYIAVEDAKIYYQNATYIAFETITVKVPVNDAYALITVSLSGANTVSINGTVA